MLIKHGDNCPINQLDIHGIDDSATENKMKDLKDNLSKSDLDSNDKTVVTEKA